MSQPIENYLEIPQSDRPDPAGKAESENIDGFIGYKILDTDVQRHFYPLALRTLGHALYYNAATYHTEKKLLLAIAMDHALFQLGTSLVFFEPFSLPEGLKSRIRDEMKQIITNPWRIVHHISFEHLLHKYADKNLTTFFDDFIKKWKRLRRHLNLGFPIPVNGEKISKENAEALADDIDDLYHIFGDAFTYSIKSTCSSNVRTSQFVLTALRQLEKLFRYPDKYYSRIYALDILATADKLRQDMYYMVKVELFNA